MKRLLVLLGALMAAVLLAALSAGGGRQALAQASAPDLAQFGYPQVLGSVSYTPGQTETLAAGNQQVILPADFISKTVTFELLQGDPSSFSASLPITDQGRTVIAAFAFRVRDTTTNQLLARFDKPVQWSITDPAIVEGSAVYNTSAANPPVVTANAAPGTISGTTLSHPFGGAGVGWLVLAPAAAPSPTAVAPTAVAPTAAATETALPTTLPTEVPTLAPVEAATVTPQSGPAITETATSQTAGAPGMPGTGGSQQGSEAALPVLLVIIAMASAAAGLALRRRRAS